LAPRSPPAGGHRRGRESVGLWRSWRGEAGGRAGNLALAARPLWGGRPRPPPTGRARQPI